LGEEVYDLQAICEMKVPEWKKINIEFGLGLQIARFAQAETMDMHSSDLIWDLCYSFL
jgi:hypothetical protein